MCIINNSHTLQTQFSKINGKHIATNLNTYDLSTLYTSLPHKKLKTQMRKVITMAFDNRSEKFISIYSKSARWTNTPRVGTTHVDKKTLINITNWLINNIYVCFGDKVFRQIIGIPMCNDCAPFIANLFLFGCEYDWMVKMRALKRWNLLHNFK